jgi:hypothetical protein
VVDLRFGNEPARQEIEQRAYKFHRPAAVDGVPAVLVVHWCVEVVAERHLVRLLTLIGWR